MSSCKRLQVVAWVLLLAVAVGTVVVPGGGKWVAAAEDGENAAAVLEGKAVDFLLNEYEDTEELDPYSVYVLTQAQGLNWGEKNTKEIAQYLLALVALELEEEADRMAELLLESHGENSFENSVYSDFWGYLALAEAGRLDDLDEETVRNYIVGKQAADGSWGESYDGVYYPDVLATTEALRVLYRLGREGTEEAIDAGLSYLKGFLGKDGGLHKEWDDPVLDTAALVITLLELEEDPTGPEWSVEEANPVTYLLTQAYNEEDGSFGTYPGTLTPTYVLQASIMLQEAGLGDGSGGGTSPDDDETPPDGGDNLPPEEDEFKVRVLVVGKEDEVLFGPGDVTITEDNPWGKTALGALHATELDYKENGGFVSEIAGQANEGMNGWMYQVNGVTPSVIASAKKLEAGDKVMWWYSSSPEGPPDFEDFALLLQPSGEGEGQEDAVEDGEEAGEDQGEAAEDGEEAGEDQGEAAEDGEEAELPPEDGDSLKAEELAQRAVDFILGEYDPEEGLDPYCLSVLALAGEDVDLTWLGRDWIVWSLKNKVKFSAAEVQEGTKAIAQYLLALVGLGLEEEAGKLAVLLIDRHGDNSFENSVYSDFWGYLALAEAGRLDDLDEETVRAYILGKQAADGSWGESFAGVYYPDVLATTEALRVLYRLGGEGTEEAIEAGLSYLKGFLGADGGLHDEWGDPVLNTAALAITLLELEEDPTGPDWSVGEANPVTYLLTQAYNEEDGSFGTYRNALTATYALHAYIMLQEAGLGDGSGGGTSPDDDETPPDGGGSLPPKEDEEEQGEKFQVKVKVVGKEGKVLFGPEKVTITENNPWGKTALGALHATGLSYKDDGGFVWKIEGQANEGMNGWMYQVNGVTPSVIASAKKLEDGDEVLWWYSSGPDALPPGFNDSQENLEEETGLDKELTEALAETAAGGEITVTFSEGEDGLEAVFRAGKITKLAEKQITLVFQGPNPTDPMFLVPAAALATSAVEEAVAEDEAVQIQLGCRRLPVAEQEGIAAELTLLEQQGISLVGDEIYYLEVSLGEDKLSDFAAEITLRFPLPAEYPSADINYTGVYRLPAESGEEGKYEYVPSIPVQREGEEGYYLEVKLDGFSYFALLKATPTFADIEGHWAQEAVELMAARNIIAGMSQEEFAPDLPVTRAQLAAMLVKALGLKPAAPAEPTFQDVDAQTWYFAPVETAYQAGLVTGRGKALFDPAAPVTRQELAVMVARAMETYSERATATYQVEANLLRFRDRDTIAPWAKGAAARVIQERIMTGVPGRRFAPEETATRAQAAVVLKNLLQDMGKLL